MHSDSEFVNLRDVIETLCYMVGEDSDGVEEVMQLPSIDIVRCRECKYWKGTVQMPNGTEVKCLYGRTADDFCSYGSRSEKPNNSKERSRE